MEKTLFLFRRAAAAISVGCMFCSIYFAGDYLRRISLGGYDGALWWIAAFLWKAAMVYLAYAVGYSAIKPKFRIYAGILLTGMLVLSVLCLYKGELVIGINYSF